MFGRKGLGGGSAPVGLRSIIVRSASLTDGAKPYELACDVVDFVNHALRNAHYRREELPQEAMWAYHVDYYIAQVNNGGHGQFAHNSRWADYTINDIRAGLAAIGHDEAREMFASFETFQKVETDRFEGSMERSGFGQEDSFVEKLNTRFYAGLNDDLVLAMRKWLAGLPCLLALDADQYRDVMSGLASNNPSFATRKAEMEQAALDDERSDPIVQSLRYLCALTPGGATYRRWLSAQPLRATDLSGMSFKVDIADRVIDVLITPQIAAVQFPGEDRLRAKIPTAFLDAFLARQGMALPDNIKQGVN